MKLFGMGLVLMAAAIAVMLALWGFEHAGTDRAQVYEGGGQERWNPEGPTPGVAPPSASWGGIFDANWR